MAASTAPIIMKEAFTLPSIGIKSKYITEIHVTMESDKYICVRQNNLVIIIDLNMPNQPLRMPLTADSALMNPISRILASKAQLRVTTQDYLQIFNIETKMLIKSHLMHDQIVFWKWITPEILGLVTQTLVYHWSIQGDAEPVKMFVRTENLKNNQIINYCSDPAEKWLVLIGTAPGSAEAPQVVKGNMQLFSVDQQHSQSLEAHAASFASFKVSGNETPSTLICFASKTTNAGKITSMLYVNELGSEPGEPAFTNKQADMLIPRGFTDDFPVAIQISQKYGLIYVITKLGLLYLYDLETATAVYGNIISPDPIFLTSEASSVGGFYAVNQRGQVLLATVNEATIVPFVIGHRNDLELAVNLAKRGNLVGAENIFVEKFQELLSQTKYKEAAALVAESPQGFLRTPDTLATFQSVLVQAGQIPPLLQYFGALLIKGKLNSYESLELSRIVVHQNKKHLLESWLAEDKLECSEELGDLVKPMDNDLALKIFIRARFNPKEAAVFAERRQFDEIPIYSMQTVDYDIVPPNPALDESLPKERFLERVKDIELGLENEHHQNFDRKDDLNGKVIETVKVVDVLKERTHGSSNSIESKLGELERKKIQQYSSEDLTSITKNFIDRIGSGAYGDVFKGKLPDGVQVAVKKLKDIAMNVMENTFMAEVGTMSRTSHRNLVRLHGYCFEASTKALVYEYLENGSLDKVLYENYLNLRWENLYDIAIGTAVGLSYLHEGCDDEIVHYDVKPGNVLLDSKLSPKVADFGMAKISQRDLSHISVIEFRGTRSYAAPEMFMQMPVTVKSDIYSFGMLLFEILGRRRNLDGHNWLPGQVWEKFKKEKLDEIMEECGIEDKNKVKAKTLCTVALWCTQYRPDYRPTMSEVVQLLKGKMQFPTPPDPYYPYSASSGSSSWGGGSTKLSGPSIVSATSI